MPTAAESGALLGLAYELRTSALQYRSFCGVRLAIAMFTGAVVAGTVSRWDREARITNKLRKEKAHRFYSANATWY